MVFVDPMTSLHDANDLVQTCIYMNIYAYYVYAFFRFITWKQGDVVLAASLPGVGFIRNTPPPPLEFLKVLSANGLVFFFISTKCKWEHKKHLELSFFVNILYKG